MTAMHYTPSATRGSSRWLLLGSLALNLFFIGAAIALTIRAPAPPPTWDRDVFVRVERLANALPAADADILRGHINADRSTIESTQTEYRSAQNNIRATLRQQPFDPEAMQAAMAKTRAARLAFDQTIQAAFASAAAQMSQAGRKTLADWPPGRKSESGKP